MRRKGGTWTSPVLALAAAAVLLPLAAPGAVAHMGTEDVPTGTLTIEPWVDATLQLEQVHAEDVLQWTWTVAGGPEGAADAVSTQLVWRDANGEAQVVPADPAGQTFGRFIAPKEIDPSGHAVSLLWRNEGDAPVTVEWTYLSSAEFWSRPDLYMPAAAPLFFLVGAVVFGKVWDRRRKQARRAAGFPPMPAGPPAGARPPAAPPSTPLAAAPAAHRGAQAAPRATVVARHGGTSK